MFSKPTYLVTLATLLLAVLVTSAIADDTKPIRLVANLTTIDGNTLTLAGPNGNVTLTVNDSTKYRRDSAPNTTTTLADLKVGQSLRVYYTGTIASLVNITGGTTTAPATQAVRLVANLTAISGTTLTLAGPNNTTITITVNDSTKYRSDASPSSSVTLANIKVGQTLRIYYDATGNIAALVNITK